MINKRIIGSITELYIGGGNSWITEAKPTCYRTFSKQRPLIGSQTEADFTEWTDAEKAAWEANPPKPAERTDATALYEAAGAKLNEATGYYEMHDGAIVDLTEDDMAAVYEAGYPPIGGETYYYYLLNNVRTHVRPRANGYNRANVNRMFFGCSGLEVATMAGIVGGESVFRGCWKLRFVGSRYAAFYNDVRTKYFFAACTALENVHVQVGAGGQFSLADSPLVNVESLEWIATKSATLPDSPRQVILHPKTYAKLTAEIVDTATAKGITFVEASAHCDGTPYTDEELA